MVESIKNLVTNMISINKYNISRDNKPYIIAELSANHNGSLEYAKRTIKHLFKFLGKV